MSRRESSSPSERATLADVETRTQPRAAAPAETEHDALGALLACVPKELVGRGPELVSLLEQTSTSGLTPHAGRLLALLDHTTFRRATSTEMTPREAIVRAVLRLGYPWALQLTAEDVALARLEESRVRQRSGRTRGWLAMLGAVVLVLAGSVALNREKFSLADDVLRERARVFAVASLDEVAPRTSRGETLSALMMELAKADRFDEGIAVGFDCLADPELMPSTCLTGLARVLEWRDRNSELPARQQFSLIGEALNTRWEVADRAHPPPGLVQKLNEVRGRWLRPEGAASSSPEQVAAAGRLEIEARQHLEDGRLAQAVAQAEACLSQFPDALGCHFVLYTAHSALASQVPFGEIKPHADAMERHRRAIARLVSHEKRLACERGTVPTPRPLGCPGF